MDKPLILIVDDEREYADRMVKAVKKSGKYDCLAAYSAKDALFLITKHNSSVSKEKNPIQVILLDIKMPEMDGLKLAELVRKLFAPTIGIIMVTAFEDEEKWGEALSSHIAGYIRKPFEVEELLKKLETFFSGDQEAPYHMISDTIMEGLDRMAELKKEQGDKSWKNP